MRHIHEDAVRITFASRLILFTEWFPIFSMLQDVLATRLHSSILHRNLYIFTHSMASSNVETGLLVASIQSIGSSMFAGGVSSTART